MSSMEHCRFGETSSDSEGPYIKCPSKCGCGPDTGATGFGITLGLWLALIAVIAIVGIGIRYAIFLLSGG